MSGETINVSLEYLKALAVTANRNGTTDAFISLALQWAELADKEINRLQNKNRHMTLALGLDPDSKDEA